MNRRDSNYHLLSLPLLIQLEKLTISCLTADEKFNIEKTSTYLKEGCGRIGGFAPTPLISQ